jgi:hypothetical protein
MSVNIGIVGRVTSVEESLELVQCQHCHKHIERDEFIEDFWKCDSCSLHYHIMCILGVISASNLGTCPSCLQTIPDTDMLKILENIKRVCISIGDPVNTVYAMNRMLVFGAELSDAEKIQAAQQASFHGAMYHRHAHLLTFQDRAMAPGLQASYEPQTNTFRFTNGLSIEQQEALTRVAHKGLPVLIVVMRYPGDDVWMLQDANYFDSRCKSFSKDSTLVRLVSSLHDVYELCIMHRPFLLVIMGHGTRNGLVDYTHAQLNTFLHGLHPELAGVIFHACDMGEDAHKVKELCHNLQCTVGLFKTRIDRVQIDIVGKYTNTFSAVTYIAAMCDPRSNENDSVTYYIKRGLFYDMQKPAVVDILRRQPSMTPVVAVFAAAACALRGGTSNSFQFFAEHLLTFAR